MALFDFDYENPDSIRKQATRSQATDPVIREQLFTDALEQGTRGVVPGGESFAEGQAGRALAQATEEARQRTLEGAAKRLARGSVPSGEARPPQANLALAASLLNQNGLITNIPIAKATPPAAPSSKAAGGQAAPVEPPPLAPQEQERLVQERRGVQERTAPAGDFKSGAAIRANQRLSLVTGTPTVYDPESALSRVADAAAGGSSKVSAADIDDAIAQLSASTPKFVNEQRDVAETLKGFKRLKAESVQAGRTLARSAEASLDPTDPTVSAKTWRDRVFELAETLPEQQRQAAIDTALQQVPESVQRSLQVEFEAEVEGARQGAVMQSRQQQAARDEQDAYARNTAAGLEPPSGLAWPGTIEELRTDPDRAEDYKYFLNAQASGEALYNPDMTRTQKPKPETPAPTRTAAGLVPAARLEESLAKAAAVPPSSKADEIVPINNPNTIATEIYDLVSADTDPEAALTQVTTRRYEELNARGMPPSASVESYTDSVRAVVMPRVQKLNTDRRALENRQQAEAQQAQAKTSLGAEGQRQDVADLIVPQITGLDPVKAGETALGQAVAVVAGKLGVVVEDLALVGEVKAAVDSIVDKSLVGRNKALADEMADVEKNHSVSYKTVIAAGGTEADAERASRATAPFKELADQGIVVADRRNADALLQINALPEGLKKEALQYLRKRDGQQGFFKNAPEVLQAPDSPFKNLDKPASVRLMEAVPGMEAQAEQAWREYMGMPHKIGGMVNLQWAIAKLPPEQAAKLITQRNMLKGVSVDSAGNVQVTGEVLPEAWDGLNTAISAVLQRDPKTNKFLPPADSIEKPVVVMSFFGGEGKYDSKKRPVPEFHRNALKIHGTDPDISEMLNADNAAARTQGLLLAVVRHLETMVGTANAGLTQVNRMLMSGDTEDLLSFGRPGAGYLRRPETASTENLIGSIVSKGLAGGLMKDSDAVEGARKKLANTHLHFQQTVHERNSPILSGAGFDVSQYKQIDDAFVAARKRLGDETAYGGFGLEGAARRYASEALEGKSPSVRVAVGGKEYILSESSAVPFLRGDVAGAKRAALEETYQKTRVEKVGPDKPLLLYTSFGEGERGAELLRETIIENEASRGIPRARAEAMIDKRLQEAQDKVVDAFVQSRVAFMSKQTAADAAQAGQATAQQSEADALYNDL